MNELERTKQALDVARSTLNRTDICNPDVLAAAVKEIDAILDGTPEMETVEVESWMGFNAKGVVVYCGQTCPNATHYANIVKLTGTFQRQKPQKVERSVTMTVDAAGRWRTHGLNDNLILKIGDELKGIFTWQEDSK